MILLVKSYAHFACKIISKAFPPSEHEYVVNFPGRFINLQEVAEKRKNFRFFIEVREALSVGSILALDS